MTFFGEIVEPSTRALVEDEFEELQEYVRSSINWNGSPEPPQVINNLLFIETDKLLKLVSLGLSLQEKNPICKINNTEVAIYQFSDNYLVVFSGSKTLVFGEVVQVLASWITKAKNTYAITSSSIALYQNYDFFSKTGVITKCLTTHCNVPFNFCTKLEAPNLITCLGASVLSFCVHNKLHASLFIVYMDNSPLDSINSRSVIDLLKEMKFPFKNVSLLPSTLSSNLYM